MAIFRKIFLPIVAVALTLGVLWYGHRPPPPPREATWTDVEREAQAGGYHLITTAALAGLYRKGSGGLLVVDTRQPWEYRSGHIRGAVNFSIAPTWWSRWRARGSLAQLLGPDKDRPAVFY